LTEGQRPHFLRFLCTLGTGCNPGEEKSSPTRNLTVRFATFSSQRVDEALYAQRCAKEGLTEAIAEAQVWREALDEMKYDMEKVQKASAQAQVCGKKSTLVLKLVGAIRQEF
jgi:hypothetical protein